MTGSHSPVQTRWASTASDIVSLVGHLPSLHSLYDLTMSYDLKKIQYNVSRWALHELPCRWYAFLTPSVGQRPSYSAAERKRALSPAGCSERTPLEGYHQVPFTLHS